MRTDAACDAVHKTKHLFFCMLAMVMALAMMVVMLMILMIVCDCD
jgi:uncharacterized protein YpmS